MKRIYQVVVCCLVVSIGFLGNVGCKKVVEEEKIDLSGNWRFTSKLSNGETLVRDYQFVGGADEGSVFFNGKSIGIFNLVVGGTCYVIVTVDEDRSYVIENYNGSHVTNKEITGDVVLTYSDSNDNYGKFTAVKK